MSAEKTLIVFSHLADNALHHHAKTLRLSAIREHQLVSSSTLPLGTVSDGRVFGPEPRERAAPRKEDPPWRV